MHLFTECVQRSANVNVHNEDTFICLLIHSKQEISAHSYATTFILPLKLRAEVLSVGGLADSTK